MIPQIAFLPPKLLCSGYTFAGLYIGDLVEQAKTHGGLKNQS